MPTTAKVLEEHFLGALLPFWREHGRGADGGFVSLVGADGAPVPDETRRLLVQTRQLYAFSAGHALGGDEGLLGVARESFEHLLGVWHDERHGGFFHTARPGGEPLDRSKDSYDHAFVVFALAHYHRASGDARALALANECLERVRERLADPRAGGYFEAGEEDWTPRREGPRNQNPHMHWVEALLALHAASGDASLLDEARALVRLLEARWLDGARGCLLETFDADWSRLPGSARVEPGHHYEWTWLLTRYAEASGDDAARALGEKLFAFAEAHGLDRNGGVFDELDPRGHVVRKTKRLWPQTERVKCLALGDDAAALDTALEHCLSRYVTPGGAWHELLERSGRPKRGPHHATSVYHVVFALSEAIHALRRHRHRSAR